MTKLTIYILKGRTSPSARTARSRETNCALDLWCVVLQAQTTSGHCPVRSLFVVWTACLAWLPMVPATVRITILITWELAAVGPSQLSESCWSSIITTPEFKDGTFQCHQHFFSMLKLVDAPMLRYERHLRKFSWSQPQQFCSQRDTALAHRCPSHISTGCLIVASCPTYAPA